MLSQPPISCSAESGTLPELTSLPRYVGGHEIENHKREQFVQEVIRAIRVGRSAIKILALSIPQYENVWREVLGVYLVRFPFLIMTIFYRDIKN